MTFISINLNWDPFVRLFDCHDKGPKDPLVCQAEGMVQDIAQLVSAKHNLTIRHAKDRNNDWGMQPKSGPLNVSGEWAGVMGGVVSAS